MPTLNHRSRTRQYTWRCLPFGLFVLQVLFLSPPTMAQSLIGDPHALFEDRCGRCHGHAGAFALEKLTIENDEVVGQRSGKVVLKTLASHFGRLTDVEARQVVDMFRRQIEAGGLYQTKCRICHDPAKDFARRTLMLRDGQLFGRYSGRPVVDLLSYHGRLQDDERMVLLDMLAWQVATGRGEAVSD
jgi:hypothetical protein